MDRLQADRDLLIEAISLLDKAEADPEGASQLLWNHDYSRIREILMQVSVDCARACYVQPETKWLREALEVYANEDNWDLLFHEDAFGGTRIWTGDDHYAWKTAQETLRKIDG